MVQGVTARAEWLLLCTEPALLALFYVSVSSRSTWSVFAPISRAMRRLPSLT